MFLSCHISEDIHTKDLWLLDSGCSNHMTGNKDLISCIDTSTNSEITLGDDSRVKAQGKGIVPILTKQNQRKEIHDVYYVPNLKHNLISVGQLMEHGYDIIFKGTTCIFDKPPSRRLIAKIERTKNRMFPLNLRSAILSQSFSHNVSSMDESQLWHCRFGHLPFKSLSLLQKQSMVKGLPVLKDLDNQCESCILGKHKRDSFPSSSNRAKEHLELVHTDLCGPMQTQSIGGSSYFLTFIDDFSRKIWIYFLKNKSDTFSKFKQFKAEAEKQSAKYIKVLRSDRGGEYNSKDFIDFCKQHGIIMQTTRYTPQQNGVAERKNQTIMNMARCMLKEKNLCNDYWAEVVATAVYILNRSPTISVQGKVPQEAWFGTKLNVAHFRIFGCIAFAHVPEELRQKLDNRSEKCIFVGYSEQSKAYRLYNPVTKKFVMSRDVKFLENKSWSDQENETLNGPNPLQLFDEPLDQQVHPPRPPRL